MQCATYRSLLEALAPRPVTVRTFDIGEERPAGLARRERFGLRGIRGALHTDERFRTQIRALLRAADAGVLRILLPFVTTAEELRQARAVVADAARLLGRSAQVPVGAMIEVPAAALTVDQLAEHADFLSVGTNDLIQYTLAVDRGNRRIAHLFQPFHPAVLRLIDEVARAAEEAGAGLAVCGEMGSNSRAAALLLGFGVRRFSMVPARIPRVKQVLGRVDTGRAREVAEAALRARSPEEVRARIDEGFGSAFRRPAEDAEP
jgi:phosphoenolpyruvate-protein kinase (PTS system EI component)